MEQIKTHGEIWTQQRVDRLQGTSVSLDHEECSGHDDGQGLEGLLLLSVQKLSLLNIQCDTRRENPSNDWDDIPDSLLVLKFRNEIKLT